MKDLKSELSGDFRELTLALYMYAPAYDAKCLRRAMKGMGTKESVRRDYKCRADCFRLIPVAFDFNIALCFSIFTC